MIDWESEEGHTYIADVVSELQGTVGGGKTGFAVDVMVGLVRRGG